MNFPQRLWAQACLYGYVLMLLSCQTRPPHAATIVNKKGDTILLGAGARSQLLLAPYTSWFSKNYQVYNIDTITADSLKPLLKGKQIRIFMGSWCGDSRREVPRLFKLLDYCGFDSASVQLVFTGNEAPLFKQSPRHEEKGEDIFRVPDLIVLESHKELGRIVESPVISIEKDLLAICSGKAYIPSYKGVAFLRQAFITKKLRRIRKELPELARQINPLVASPAELATYGKVMQQEGARERADIAFRINALIFPQTAPQAAP